MTSLVPHRQTMSTFAVCLDNHQHCKCGTLILICGESKENKMADKTANKLVLQLTSIVTTAKGALEQCSAHGNNENNSGESVNTNLRSLYPSTANNRNNSLHRSYSFSKKEKKLAETLRMYFSSQIQTLIQCLVRARRAKGNTFIETTWLQ